MTSLGASTMKPRPKKEALTATASLLKIRAGVAAAGDAGSKKPKGKKNNPLIRTGGNGPDLPGDEEQAGGVAPKAYNVMLQLADASGTSAGPVELSPNDVPAQRTKMCQNRMSILQREKKKLEDKRRATIKEIERKTALRNVQAADLTWKHREIAFVGEKIADCRTDNNRREAEIAQNTAQARDEILASTKEIGEEMRAAQREAEIRIMGVSEFDLTAQKRRNQECEQASRVAITQVFDEINMARTDNGIKMRETRAKNTETLRTVAEQELKRLQTLNETVKKEQELSATRLKMKLETTQKQMTLEYVAGRTVLFNEFKKAAAVTANMQENTATIVEELRNKYESTRDLERQLAKI